MTLDSTFPVTKGLETTWTSKRMGLVKIMIMMIMMIRMMAMEIIKKYERKKKNSDGAYHASTRLTRGPSVAARSQVSGKK